MHRWRRLATLLLTVIATAVIAAAQLEAQQTLRANVLRPLQFNAVSGGITSAGSLHAPSDTGAFEVIGRAGARVEVWFNLPATFNGPRGEVVPVTFDATSAAYSAAQTPVDGQRFDPRLRQTFTVPSTGRFLIYLAGRVAVHAAQLPGRYHAQVVLFANEVPW
ncbi:MAG: hypothetical protein KF689_14080 [Gemmatimonadaceae bacterium]|nr:hypothetical protein [Gemmatimonadaceae bacterium]MCW5826885.1 hypothetical protein [Gemmatimonadaceae bacterium]